MGAGDPNYLDATGERLGELGALRAARNYAAAYVGRGDREVLHVLSDGTVERDGGTCDPAVWGDWTEAWERSAALRSSASEEDSVPMTIQHGFRALHALLASDYQPITQTLVSQVLADCELGLSDDAVGAAVRDRWRIAVRTGATLDISSRRSS